MEDIDAIMTRVLNKVMAMGRAHVYTAWARPQIIVIKPQAGTGRRDRVKERLDTVEYINNVVDIREYLNRPKRWRNSGVCPDDGNESW